MSEKFFEPYWPEIFQKNNVDDKLVSEILAQQLIGWGNIKMGYEPPNCDFFDTMTMASKITGVFTGDECLEMADKIIQQRKKSKREELEEFNDGYIVETSYESEY
jgi:hypothetical protein